MTPIMITETQSASLGVDLERLEVLDKFFSSLVSEGKQDFIAARVLRRGMKVFSGDYGVSSPGGPPLTADAIFPVASVTKPFTAALIAILQEDGLVDLLDPVQRYFPDFVGEEKEGVLLWQLLSHCSGMDEEAAGEYVEAYLKDNPDVERPSDYNTYCALCLRAPLKTTPGTAYSYNNVGYNMIAEIVTALTGESIDAFARRRIFDPLGMEDTFWVLPESKWSRVVKRNASFAGGYWLNSEGMLTDTSGNGGLKTTMDDLARFGQMFMQNGRYDGKRILSPASVRMITTDHNPTLPPSNWHVRVLGSNWGFGWNVKAGKKDDLGMLRSDKAYDHGGYGGARLMIDPEHELVLSLYTVEHKDGDPYPYQSRAVNILYSALD